MSLEVCSGLVWSAGQDLEWDEAVITLIPQTDRHKDFFFVLHCDRGLSLDGLIKAGLQLNYKGVCRTAPATQSLLKTTAV